jgi:hypothetical protein
MPFSFIRRAVCCAGLLLLAGCTASSDSTAPDQRATSDLRLLTLTLDAPPLVTTTKSFYAVRGRNAGVDLWYRPRLGQRDSTKFLEFRMGGSTLDRRPDGSAIAEGDSVLITVIVTDPTRLVVEFQPSGLTFSAKDPAKLKMFFGECGDDLNRDGKVDGSDDSVAQQLSIWRRESLDQPWFKLSSAVVKENKEIDAELGGFTGYAIAN